MICEIGDPKKVRPKKKKPRPKPKLKPISAVEISKIIKLSETHLKRLNSYKLKFQELLKTFEKEKIGTKRILSIIKQIDNYIKSIENLRKTKKFKRLKHFCERVLLFVYGKFEVQLKVLTALLKKVREERKKVPPAPPKPAPPPAVKPSPPPTPPTAVLPPSMAPAPAPSPAPKPAPPPVPPIPEEIIPPEEIAPPEEVIPPEEIAPPEEVPPALPEEEEFPFVPTPEEEVPPEEEETAPPEEISELSSIPSPVITIGLIALGLYVLKKVMKG